MKLTVPVIGILRGVDEAFFPDLVTAAFDAGLQAMEVTMNTAGAERMVEKNLSRVPKGNFLGIGTVRNAEEAKRALFAKVARNDYSVGLNLTGNGIDDPDQAFYENYACGSERNYTHYCNKELEALFDKQSVETDVEKRKKMVWDIDKKLQEDVARPILMHARSGTCWKPYVKNMTIMNNSAYNGYRYEGIWLDK